MVNEEFTTETRPTNAPQPEAPVGFEGPAEQIHYPSGLVLPAAPQTRRTARKRVWDRIGLAMTAYTAVSGLVLLYFIVCGGLSDDSVNALEHSMTAACPISTLIWSTAFINTGLCGLAALLPMAGWLLLRKGFRAGRVIVIVMMAISLVSAGVLFIAGSGMGSLWVLLLSLPKILVPLVVLNAMTHVSPAAPEATPATP